MADVSLVPNFLNAGPRPPLAYRRADGKMYSIQTIGTISQFTVSGGRLAVTVSVSGQVHDPSVDNFWHPYGPENWTFFVATAKACSVDLVLEVDPEFGVPDATPSIAVVDLSVPDAAMLDKYVNAGRASQAAALLDRVLGLS